SGSPTTDEAARDLEGEVPAQTTAQLGDVQRCWARVSDRARRLTEDLDQTLTFLLPLRSERRRLSSLNTFLRIRILGGVISTSSSDSMYSSASSRVSSRGGLSRMFLSEPEARILVSFFSLQGLTTISSPRAFSAMIIPS